MDESGRHRQEPCHPQRLDSAQVAPAKIGQQHNQRPGQSGHYPGKRVARPQNQDDKGFRVQE